MEPGRDQRCVAGGPGVALRYDPLAVGRSDTLYGAAGERQGQECEALARLRAVGIMSSGGSGDDFDALLEEAATAALAAKGAKGAKAKAPEKEARPQSEWVDRPLWVRRGWLLRLTRVVCNCGHSSIVSEGCFEELQNWRPNGGTRLRRLETLEDFEALNEDAESERSTETQTLAVAICGECAEVFGFPAPSRWAADVPEESVFKATWPFAAQGEQHEQH